MQADATPGAGPKARMRVDAIARDATHLTLWTRTASGRRGRRAWGAVVENTRGHTWIGERLANPARATRRGELRRTRKGRGHRRMTGTRMALLAGINALNAIEERKTLTLVTDSKTLADGMTHQLERWKTGGWRKSDGKALSDKDLWKRLDQAAARHDVTWQWAAAEAREPNHERARAIARLAVTHSEPPDPETST